MSSAHRGAGSLGARLSFHISHRYGGDDPDVPFSALDSLLAELRENPDDLEHPCVAVVHDSDWAIAVFTSGLVTLENVDELEIEPRHLRVERPEDARQLLVDLAQGHLDVVFAAEWLPGYGTNSA